MLLTTWLLTCYFSLLVLACTLQYPADAWLASAVSFRLPFRPKLQVGIIGCRGSTLSSAQTPVDSTIAYTAMSMEDIGKMKRDDIEAELELLNIPYGDCITKVDLSRRLAAAYATLAAREKFEAFYNEEAFNTANSVIKDSQNNRDAGELVQNDSDYVGEDNAIVPDGMSMEVILSLASNPKVARLLQDPKLRDVLQATKTQGPQGLKRYLADPDTMLLLEALNRAIAEQIPKHE